MCVRSCVHPRNHRIIARSLSLSLSLSLLYSFFHRDIINHHAHTPRYYSSSSLLYHLSTVDHTLLESQRFTLSSDCFRVSITCALANETKIPHRKIQTFIYGFDSVKDIYISLRSLNPLPTLSPLPQIPSQENWTRVIAHDFLAAKLIASRMWGHFSNT